ncbi:MAG: hypothetical protein RIA63_13525, partial [Cyclobacteriaceae bacterium]
MVIKINLALPLFFWALLSQGQPSSLGGLESENSNHVVIGAFSSRENAVHFTDQAKVNYPEAQLNINASRHLHYVYILKTGNRVKAFAEARRLRKETKYDDAWVYFGALGENIKIVDNSANDSPSIEPARAEGGPDAVKAESKNEAAIAAEVKAFSLGEEPTGLNLSKEISGAKTETQKKHYQGIQEVKESVAKLDGDTKVIIFKDDAEGRKALRALGYEVEEGKPITGFFDSGNNILAVNATESQADEPFHEGLKPVVKFLRKKNPEMFDSFAAKASALKHPTRGVIYGELSGTDEEALAEVMADVAKGYFENSGELKGEATSLMKEILETLGVESTDLALGVDHLKTTANNLAVAVREATGFDEEGNRKFRFRLYNTSNMKKVTGEVELVSESGRKIASYPGNELSQVMRADASGNIILACEVLGYRKLLFKLNYDNPFLTEGVTRGEDEEAIVPFGLVRLQKGDIAVMYNVYFFRDAAIMRPESKYEVNNLLAMMNENSNYKIMLHGHANGNSSGKIITMAESKNYFSLSDTKEGHGSAKKLSEERAEVIRAYLIDQGIAED